MRLRTIYLDSIKNSTLFEELIREAPHTRITGHIPDELSFLNGEFVDLGFEDFDIPTEQKRALMLAFAGNGVQIPGTNWKLRHTRPGDTQIEPAEQGDVMLPENWAAVVVVMTGDHMTWIGKAVRPDRIGRVNLDEYQDVGDGFALQTLAIH